MLPEELAIVDLLTKPDITLTDKEKLEVKKVAKALLETLKQEKLVLDWRRRQQSKAAVKVAIEEISLFCHFPGILNKRIKR
jgi:type I restriction enzyme R subunit